MASRSALESVAQRQPEWAPWLGAVGIAYEERNNPTWDAAIAAGPEPPDDQPRISGARISVGRAHVEQLWSRLLGAASRVESPSMATLGSVHRDAIDPTAMLASAVTHDRAAVTAAAAASGVEEDSLAAVVDLLAWPLLQACGRRWRSGVTQWERGFCPVCAAWPAFAELRGIERRRFNRCGRCGSEWQALMLRCVFCRLSDHEQLISLVPGTGAPTATVDACTGCGGYLKTLIRLQGAGPAEVIVEDLATVDLDLAALEAGYARPHEPAASVALTFVPASERRRLVWH